MRKKLLFFVLASALLFSCSAYEGGTSTRRVQPSEDPAESTPVEAVPQIILDQEIQNCTDATNCELEALGDDTNPLRINSLIVAEADVFNTQNINDAPTIRFTISEVEASDIESVTYIYTKKDSLENIITQSDEKPAAVNNDIYYIPLHVSNLGSGIMTSAPYEKHTLSVKIKTSPNNKIYTYDVNFALLSSYQNPVTLNRDSTVMDSSYYKMDQDLSDFIIDSVDISNTLPYAVTVAGNINVSSSTIAILSNTHRVQMETGIPHSQYYYPWTQYAMTTGTNVEYNEAVAAPIFKLLVTRGSGTPEEQPTTVAPGGTSSALSFSDLTLQGNETIKVDVYIHVEANNTILGAQGSQTFLEGQTICQNVTPTSECTCFSYIPDLHTQNSLMYGMYGCGMLLSSMNNTFYPNCSPPQNSCIQTLLNVVQYPQSFLELVGRDHTTNISYTITSWLKGYENLDSLGSSTKTLDTIHITKGYVDYSAINNSLSYTGYIPGHVE